MAYAKVDPVVLGYLGRALSLELTAVQQYLTLSCLLKIRGFTEIANKFQSEAQDEVSHAERIIGRMIMLGVAPSGTQLRPASLGDSLPALIASAQTLEAEIVVFYQHAVEHCAGMGDFDNRYFFEQLLHEERQHAQALENWQEDYLPPKSPALTL